MDFLSIGSNDLLQFTFAADRGTPAIANRYDLLSQPMFDVLEQVLCAARAARGGQGVPVSLCGEAAGRPLEALALVGLGITALSMPASGILPVKAMLAQLDLVSFRPGAGGDPSRRGGRRQPARADRHLGARTWIAGLTISFQSSVELTLRVTCVPNGVSVGALEQTALSELDGAGRLSA